MALVSNNISGSASNNSRIGITGSVVFANVSGNKFPSQPGADTVFFVSGAVGIGSDVSSFGGDLKVTGSLTSLQGLTGSLTKLSDGSNYLRAGSNIQLTTGSSGEVTIAASMVPGPPGAGGALGYYGSFYDMSDQSAVANDTATAMLIRTSSEENGVSIANNSRITFAHAGTYNIQFSAQLHNQGGGGSGEVDIWFRMNGTDIPNSNTQVTVQTNNPYVVAAWNYVTTVNDNDYIEIMWSTSTTTIRIEAIPEVVGLHPAVPSVIATAHQIMYTQVGPQGPQGAPGTIYFDSTTAGSIYTTGSAAFRGPSSVIDSPRDIGNDVFFYVSGNMSSKPSTSPDYTKIGTAVFGGDVVISGTVFGGSPLSIGDNLIINSNQISGSFGGIPAGNITLQSGGDVRVSGDVIVGGNDIKSSGGAIALAFTGSNVVIGGDLKINGNQIYDSSGNIRFGFINGSNTNIKRADGTNSIVVDTSGNVLISNDLTVSGNLYIGNAALDSLFVTSSAFFARPLVVNGNQISGSAGGNITLESAGGVSIPGSLSASGIINSGNTTLGDVSTDSITINGNSVFIPNQLNIDSGVLYINSTLDRVGIGNTSPLYALDVSGTLSSRDLIQNRKTSSTREYFQKFLLWYNDSTSTTSSTPLYLNGTSLEYTLSSNEYVKFTIDIVGFDSTNGNSCWAQMQGTIKKYSTNAATLVGGVLKVIDDGDFTPGLFTVDAAANGDALRITVTPPTINSMRWNASGILTCIDAP